jgi:Sulfotransferase family
MKRARSLTQRCIEAADVIDVATALVLGLLSTLAGAASMFLLVFLTALLCLLPNALAAIFARDCRNIAALNIDRSNAQLADDDEICTKHVCGTVPETDMKFHERLSPQCSALMDQYKSTWSRSGRSNQLSPHPCTSSNKALGPHGPVLISSQHPIATFAMCTIPKIACTNFRKLLSTVMLYPDPMPTDSFTQFFNPHVWAYPTVWHYESADKSFQTPDSASGGTRRLQDSIPVRLKPDSGSEADSAQTVGNQSQPKGKDRLPESVPSFIIGRNPYVRVLSGFLDKMVHDPLRHDQWTYRNANGAMGLEGQTKWQNTFESFQTFVKVLAVRGIGNQVC